MKNKFIGAVLAVAMVLSLCSCGSSTGSNSGSTNKGNKVSESMSTEESNVEESSDKQIKIVTTIFPIYDWTRSVTDGTDAEVTMILDSGVDLHNFQPSADDISKITNCDIFIYVGGESDEWVEDALQYTRNVYCVSLMDMIRDNLKEEEIVEDMQGHDRDREHEDGEEHEHEDGEVEYDEHVWLSLANAKICVETIKDILVSVDSKNEKTYTDNTEAYKNSIKELDTEYKAVVSNAGQKTLLFGDRFPFRYFVDDYELSYYAAFVGCSAETEASFETIAFLANKVDELGLKNICVIEGSDRKIAEAIRDASTSKDAEIVEFNSMQNITSKSVKDGATYMGIMKDNLESLKKAINN